MGTHLGQATQLSTASTPNSILSILQRRRDNKRSEEITINYSISLLAIACLRLTMPSPSLNDGPKDSLGKSIHFALWWLCLYYLFLCWVIAKRARIDEFWHYLTLPQIRNSTFEIQFQHQVLDLVLQNILFVFNMSQPNLFESVGSKMRSAKYPTMFPDAVGRS